MSNIDNSYEYCRGYSDGFKEGHNEALQHFENSLHYNNINNLEIKIDTENIDEFKDELDKYFKKLKF